MTTHQSASLLNLLKPISVGKTAGVGARSASDLDAGLLNFSSLMAQQLNSGEGAVSEVAIAADVDDLMLSAAPDGTLPVDPQDDALKQTSTDDQMMPWDMAVPWMSPQPLQATLPLASQSKGTSSSDAVDMPAMALSTEVSSDLTDLTDLPDAHNLPNAIAASRFIDEATPVTQTQQTLLPEQSSLPAVQAQQMLRPEKTTLPAASAQKASADVAVNIDASASLQAAGLMQAGFDAAKPLARISGMSKYDPEASKTTVSVSMGRAAGLAVADLPTSMAKTLKNDKGLLSRDNASGSMSLLSSLPAQEDVSSGAKELMFSQFLTHAAGAVGQIAGHGAGASSVAAFHTVEQLAHPVGSSQFVDELVGRVGMFVRGPAQNGPMTAELHLNPTDMGPVQVRIELNGAQAQVHFMAHHADTRQAIEASLASLGDNLRDAGLQLTQANVSDSSSGSSFAQNGGSNGAMGDGQSRGSFGQQNPDGQSARRPNAEPPAVPAQPNRSSRGNSGLDMYA